MKFDLEYEGIKEFQDKLKKLKTTAQKVQFAKNLYKTSAAPLIAAGKAEAPVLKSSYDGKRQLDPVRRYKKGGGSVVATYESGNLAESIKFFTTNKGVPRFYVGNKVGKRQRNDGWYGHFVTFGAKGSTPNPFMGRAVKKTGGIVKASMGKYMRRKLEAVR